MKIFIAADLEGVSGVVHPEHTGWDGRRHQEARKWVTEHINAAVQAVAERGADEILVCDGHSNGRNVVLDMLHPQATLMWGRQGRRQGQMEGLDEEFAAVMMVGFHGRASTPGVLNHTTNSGVVDEVRINDIPMGEIDLNASIAGHYDVPIAMVSGDSAAVAQAKERMPWIETAITQEAVGTYSAKILPPARAHACIRTATERALERLDEMQTVHIDAPIQLEMRFKDTAMAETASLVPGITRVDGMTCGYTCTDILEAYRVHMVMIILGATERWTSTV